MFGGAMVYIRSYCWLIFIVIAGIYLLPQAVIGGICYVIAFVLKKLNNYSLAISFSDYAFYQLYSYDQSINTFCGGLPDETISSRVGYLMLTNNEEALIVGKVINAIFVVIKGEFEHCVKAIEWRKIYVDISANQQKYLLNRYFLTQQP